MKEMKKVISRNIYYGRWSIFIDIEGFSYFSESDIYRSFQVLLETIYPIGKNVFPDLPNRLFVHQIGGDGLLIVSELPEKDLSRPISIAVILLRALAHNGFLGKVGISIGDFADISSCWPNFYKLVDNNISKIENELGIFHRSYDRKTISLGEGFLTLFPVMGSCLINSYKTKDNGPKGPNLIIGSKLKNKIPSSSHTKENKNGFILINWLSENSNLINEITEKICKREYTDIEKTNSCYKNYLLNKSEGTSKLWLKNAKKLL